MDNITDKVIAENLTNYLQQNITPISDHTPTELETVGNIAAVLVPIFFGTIAITGFFGNTLVILVVVFNPQMHSTTNLLIVNLACADLLFVIFCIPFTATDYMTYRWPYGIALCKIVQYLIVVTAFASIYTLVLMSIDRFLAVVYPISSRAIRTERITKFSICIMWSIVILLSLPALFAHGLVEFEDDSRHLWLSCQYIDNSFLSLSTYTIIFMSVTYFIPLILISGMYIRIVSRLWRNVAGARMSAESQRGRRRVTRMVIVVVVAFASLWFPVQVILLLKSLDIYYSITAVTVLIQIGAQTLAYSSSCVNPLLYAFLSDNFRKAFHKAIYFSSKYRFYTSAQYNNVTNAGTSMADLGGRRISSARTSTSVI